MEKRYQVFISSTFQDLKNARQEVSQALLRADCFPAGMELFPAADEEQFEFIKTIIDQSDYYIIISAGRYGTIHPETGLSYTEMEYDYALQTGKPVIRLLHRDPFNELKGEFIEKTDEGRKGLENFRNKMTSSKLVKFWNSPEQLMAETVFALQDLQRRKPAVGWSKSNSIGKDLQLENFKLRQKIQNLEKKNSAVDGSERLKLYLPTVQKCLEKAGVTSEGDDTFSRVWVALEEAFLREEQAYETELVVSFKDHGGIDEDDALAIVDALQIDGVLQQQYKHYKLTQNGKKTLCVMRVRSFLS